MNTENPLESLEDQSILLEAYAASSAYVMRKALASINKLKEFEGRSELAPAMFERIERLVEEEERSDPIILGAYLYALELIRAKTE